MDSGDRLVTVTLTERDLHTVCNAADSEAFYARHRDGNPEKATRIKGVTEAMRVAWVEQVTSDAAKNEEQHHA